MNKRKSNIELLRIVAMLMVLFLHSNFLSLGYVDKVISVETFWRVMAEQLCIICVNVFVLISGWFGIKSNLKGSFSLLFQVFFYGILLACPFYFFGKSDSKATRAASCSARFLLVPSPRPTTTPLSISSTRNRFS